MPIRDRLDLKGYQDTTLPLEDDENFNCIIKENPVPEIKNKKILVEKKNDTDKTININGTFNAFLKPGEKIIIEKESILNSKIVGSYSQTNNEYATINSIDEEIPLSDAGQNSRIDKWFQNLEKDHELEQLRIDINNKEEKIKKLEYKYECLLNNNNKEVVNMKKSMMYDVLKEQLKFLIVAVSTIILSLIGIIVFATTGRYFIHPYLYVILLLMGIGWGLTAAFSIKSNKV